MTPALYIVGGAGVGKSTFTSALLSRIGGALGPLEDLHSRPNSRGTIITLRGHEMEVPLERPGLYLGVMRESFPGTDGLDRVSGLPGEEWLENGGADGYSFILGEGATLSTRRFLVALQRNTDLLMLRLTCDEMVKELWLEHRGSNQDPRFVQATATRADNLIVDMEALGTRVATVETSSGHEWDAGIDTALLHLIG